MLDRFDDRTVPKLDNLRRAADAGFEIPATVWAWAGDLSMNPPLVPPKVLGRGPWIVRSGSPTEDTEITSNAGRLLSLEIASATDFADAVRRVSASLPCLDGKRLGAVFVQPIVRSERAGVTFFDGFYYEETSKRGGNLALTGGKERGEVRRGHLRRGSAIDDWLLRLHRLFGRSIDVEWALPPGCDVPILLQARPALFSIRRNETLSLANHKEILGDPPSPWMTGVFIDAGKRAIDFFAEVDPEVATWNEPYAIEAGERAWLNFSPFFRLMDRWGLPRSLVTEGVGGATADGPADARAIGSRLMRKFPTIVFKAFHDFRTMAAIPRGLSLLDGLLDDAKTLGDLYQANVDAMAFSLRTNIAILSVLVIAAKLRRALGWTHAAHVMTHTMMERYAEIASRPETPARLAGLDDWLDQYGHRGPFESDPCRPRFGELRAALRADLERGSAPPPRPRPRSSFGRATIGRFFFLIDELREHYRDLLMRRWQRLRALILNEASKAVAAGRLDAVDDVFFLRGDDLAADPATWRDRVERRRTAVEEARRMDLPTTASRSEIDAAIARFRRSEVAPGSARNVFEGIGLGTESVTGTAVLGTSVEAFLQGEVLPETPILVASTLEPSWAVVFPKFSAVVVELGGELSHASILLREAGIPAVVNAAGAYHAIRSGDRIQVNPSAGTIRIEARSTED